MVTTIIVYNNNTGILEVMMPLFQREGYQIQIVKEKEELISAVSGEGLRLLLTDIMKEYRSVEEGLQHLAEIRHISNIPMIVVSEESSEKVKIRALNVGADDYCSTQCSAKELMARIKCQLNRYLALVKICDNIEHIYKVDDLEICDDTRKVTVNGREVRLTPIEYKILRLLVMEQGKVLSIDEIYRAIWKMNPIGADNTIAVHIRHIREKIEENPRNPRYLKVVWGTGYKVG